MSDREESSEPLDAATAGEAASPSADAAAPVSAEDPESVRRAALQPSAVEIVLTLGVVVLMGWTMLRVMAEAQFEPVKFLREHEAVAMLNAEDVRLRRRAAYRAPVTVPVVDALIPRLDDPDLFVRRYAFDRLRRMAPTGLGYDPSASPASRRRAVIAWRAWWGRRRQQHVRPR